MAAEYMAATQASTCRTRKYLRTGKQGITYQAKTAGNRNASIHTRMGKSLSGTLTNESKAAARKANHAKAALRISLEITVAAARGQNTKATAIIRTATRSKVKTACSRGNFRK